jgi:hypothetical protein
MSDLIKVKLQTYPDLVNQINERGGRNFLLASKHVVSGNINWEGQGLESNFIKALVRAYDSIEQKETNLIPKYKIAMNFEDGTGGRKMRPEFKGRSTMDLVLSGQRTGTSRDMSKEYNQHDLSIGDIIQFHDDKGRTALVQVTSLPQDIANILNGVEDTKLYDKLYTPEEQKIIEGFNTTEKQLLPFIARLWSYREGWSESVFYDLLKKGDYEQFTFKLVSEGTTNKQLSLFEQRPNQEGIVASEKTIRDVATRLSDRIGMPIEFISDREQEFKGVIRNNMAYINLAYATLDTPVHEILGHPIIRALRGEAPYFKYDIQDISNDPNAPANFQLQFLTSNSSGEENYDIDFFNTKDEIDNFIKKYTTRKSNPLYDNLVKELNYGIGKEILDRIKQDYINKSPEQLGYNKEWLDQTEIYPESAIPSKEEIASRKQRAKYTLEEQQEEALVELLGLMTAEKLDKIKDRKLISLLKQLLKEIKEYLRKLLNLKEVEINKLPDNLTIEDLSNLLAYSNSKIILPGYKVIYTTPDNMKFKTYVEASKHITDLFKSSKEVNLEDIRLKKVVDNKQIKAYKGEIEKLRRTLNSKEYIDKKEAEIKELQKEYNSLNVAPTFENSNEIFYHVKGFDYGRIQHTTNRPGDHKKELGDYEGYYIFAYNTRKDLPDHYIEPISDEKARKIWEAQETKYLNAYITNQLFQLKNKIDRIKADADIIYQIQNLDRAIDKI